MDDVKEEYLFLKYQRQPAKMRLWSLMLYIARPGRALVMSKVSKKHSIDLSDDANNNRRWAILLVLKCHEHVPSGKL
jgi:hypothetical protein